MNYNAYRKGEVLDNLKIADGIYKIRIKGEFKGKPGQFYMLRSWKRYPLLSRPFSICDKDDETITFLYQVVGDGTKKMSSLGIGDSIYLLGPLGNGFPLDTNKKTAIVSGGIGIAPMLFLAKSLNRPDLFAGFRSKPYFLDEMKEYTGTVYTATEDGSSGTKGYVTQIIKDEYDIIYCCGPNIMMNAVKDLELNAELYLSLEAHMACGIGACLGCAVETTDGIKRVCHEGPVFRGEDVILHA